MMVCAIYFITYMDRVNLATAAADIQREFHLSNTELGYAFSAYGYPYAFIQLIGGWLADGLGPRLVFPQSGIRGLLAQVRGLGTHRVRVKNGLDGVELRRQFRDLIGGIGSCHAGKPTYCHSQRRLLYPVLPVSSPAWQAKRRAFQPSCSRRRR